jgi:hypothetical protein
MRGIGRWMAVALCVLTASSCRSGGGGPRATVPSTAAALTTSSTTASTTTTLQPLSETPKVVDLAYAQRVASALTHLEGEASRLLFASKARTAEVDGLLSSFLYGEALTDEQRAMQDDLSISLKSYRSPPGDPVLQVISVESASSKCMALLADSDFRPRYTSDVGVQRVAVILQRNQRPEAADHSRTPTDWVITDAGTPTGKDLRKACA